MLLPTQAQNVYKQWWSLVSYAAGTTSPTTGGVYTTTDVTQVARDVAVAQGQPLTFSDYTGLAQLYGVARRIERAADALTSADPGDALTAPMVSEAPWSRSVAQQAAAPMWQLRVETTYRAPDGTVITSWTTGIFHTTLPTTVGALQAEAQLQAQRMLSRRSAEHNTGGELLAMGRMYLMAV